MFILRRWTVDGMLEANLHLPRFKNISNESRVKMCRVHEFPCTDPK